MKEVLRLVIKKRTLTCSAVILAVGIAGTAGASMLTADAETAGVTHYEAEGPAVEAAGKAEQMSGGEAEPHGAEEASAAADRADAADHPDTASADTALSGKAAAADTADKNHITVRAAFPTQDGTSYFNDNGVPGGYSYDYLQKISEYTGFNMEYVPYEYENLDESIIAAMNDLSTGDVDIFGPLIKNSQTQELYEFAEHSYGTVYTTLCALSSSELQENGLENASDITVGLLKDAKYRNEEIAAWLSANNVHYSAAYYDTEEQLIQALKQGVVTVISGNSLSIYEGTKIICRFSPREYYFAATKGNKELIREVDKAIELINKVQPDFQSSLFDRYYQRIGYEFELTGVDRAFLDSFGAVNVLCVDNDGPFVYRNDGKPAGALIQLLDDFSEETGAAVNYTFCSNISEMEAYLDAVDFDIVVGIPFTSEYCADIGYVRSDEIMESGLAVLQADNGGSHGTVAVQKGIEGMVNTDGYARVIYADSAGKCIEDVKTGRADAAIGDRSAMEYYIADDNIHKTMVPLAGISQKIVLAVNRDSDTHFLSILNSYIRSLTDDRLTAYMQEGSIHTHDVSLFTYLKNHPAVLCAAVSIIAVLLSVFVTILYYSSETRKRNRQLEEVLSLEKEHTAIIETMASLYTTTFTVNAKTHEYHSIKSMPKLSRFAGKSGRLDDIIPQILETFVMPEMQEDIRSFFDFSTLDERLKNTNTISAEHQNPNGEWFQSRYIVKTRDEAGRPIELLYTSRNVTDEKRRELELQKQLREIAETARRANISKTDFLRRMSHDIRTPLNGIIGMLHIAERFKDDPERVEDCKLKILHSADYLLDLVNNVLDISKLESGILKLELSPFNMEEQLSRLLPTMEMNASRNGIVFEGGAEPTEIRHPYVIGSKVHINRVIMNLVSNAIKYNRPGGSVRLSCRELYSEDGLDNELTARFEFICEDTGIGMSREFQEKAFEPFSQEGKESMTGFSGSGLGLAIVKEIVEMMGGSIELWSEEGVGSRFTVVIPLEIDQTEHETEQVKAVEKAEELKLSGRRALLVEDNEINMEISRLLLEEEGLVVTEARNGAEAVDIFNSSEPGYFDYIFMDIMMPVMDGIKAAECIRKSSHADARSIIIIAMTANAFAEDKESCLAAGMNAHIAKPIDAKLLRSVLAEL